MSMLYFFIKFLNEEVPDDCLKLGTKIKENTGLELIQVIQEMTL